MCSTKYLFKLAYFHCNISSFCLSVSFNNWQILNVVSPATSSHLSLQVNKTFFSSLAPSKEWNIMFLATCLPQLTTWKVLHFTLLSRMVVVWRTKLFSLFPLVLKLDYRRFRSKVCWQTYFSLMSFSFKERKWFRWRVRENRDIVSISGSIGNLMPWNMTTLAQPVQSMVFLDEVSQVAHKRFTMVYRIFLSISGRMVKDSFGGNWPIFNAFWRQKGLQHFGSASKPYPHVISRIRGPQALFFHESKKLSYMTQSICHQFYYLLESV